MKTQPQIHKIESGDSSFEIKIEKMGFHTISFGIFRIEKGLISTNLFDLYKKISSIIIDLMTDDRRIQTIYLMFIENGETEMNRWKKCCQYYIEKNFNGKLSAQSINMFLIVRRIGL